MKKNLFIIFLIVFQAIIFAQPVYLGKRYMHTDEYASVCITEDTIEFDNTIENGKLFQKEMFDIFNGENTNYIILDCNVRDTYFLYIIKKTNSKKLFI